MTIGFDKTNPIGVRGTKEVAQKLVALAEQIKDYKTGQVSSNIFKNIPEVSFVYLYAEECATHGWWGVQVYSVSTMSKDNLSKIVRDKEERAQQYKKCDSLWLLVVVDFIDPSQDQEIQNDDFGKVESDVFEKIIVYKTTFDHIIEAK